ICLFPDEPATSVSTNDDRSHERHGWLPELPAPARCVSARCLPGACRAVRCGLAREGHGSGRADHRTNGLSSVVSRTGVERAWLGHPAGLYILALTETWERFSFYGMRALLVFFLTERFVFSDAESFAIYGSYTALVYISPIVGGILADRYLGFSKAVFFGGLLMVAGHFGLALEDWIFPTEQGSGVHDARLQVFYLSLAFLIAGVGLLKPNISTMVGEIYPQGGAARDSGFTDR